MSYENELECEPSPGCPSWPRCFLVRILMEGGDVTVCKAIFQEMLESTDVPTTDFDNEFRLDKE